jgi:predicted TIM-barrel fold metal-dependent hydrolase
LGFGIVAILVSNEVLRIYNDWLKGFCSHYPDCQIGLACLPYGSVDLAVQEVHRVVNMGLKGFELSCSWDMEPMWHPIWEPFWQAVDEVQLPLHFHTFPTTPPRARQEAPKIRRAAMFTGVWAFQMGLIHIIAAMMRAGVFERCPRQGRALVGHFRRWSGRRRGPFLWSPGSRGQQ